MSCYLLGSLTELHEKPRACCCCRIQLLVSEEPPSWRPEWCQCPFRSAGTETGSQPSHRALLTCVQMSPHPRPWAASTESVAWGHCTPTELRLQPPMIPHALSGTVCSMLQCLRLKHGEEGLISPPSSCAPSVLSQAQHSKDCLLLELCRREWTRPPSTSSCPVPRTDGFQLSGFCFMLRH